VPLVAKVQGADILVEVNGNFTIGGPIGSPRLNSDACTGILVPDGHLPHETVDTYKQRKTST